MDIENVFTESPEDEQWRLLLNFTYPNNIKRFFAKKGIANPSDKLVEGIAGSISQAKEYYEASKISSLHIAPLLLYYGTTNLFYGASNLIRGQVNDISDHGMYLSKIPEPCNRIADIEITPVNPKKGALTLFNNIYSADSTDSDICNSGKWMLMELFGAIPDILEDYFSCYETVKPFIIPVEIVKEKNAILERIQPRYLERFENMEDLFTKIKKFSNNYLPVQYNPSQMKYVILRYKIVSDDIGIYSVSGQKYLQLSHIKNGTLINPSLEIIMFIALYSLGFISRYKPDIWNPFVKNDISGEKLLIEKLLYYSRRLLPNLVLNHLYNKKICFVTEKQKILDLSTAISEKEVEEISHKEVRKILGGERMRF